MNFVRLSFVIHNSEYFGVKVFLGKNMRILRDPLGHFTSLDLFVLFFIVALTWDLDERAIDNDAAFRREALTVELFVETVEQFLLQTEIFELFRTASNFGALKWSWRQAPCRQASNQERLERRFGHEFEVPSDRRKGCTGISVREP